MESMLRNKKTILLFMAPASLFFLAIVVFPIVSSVYYSLFNWDLIRPKRFIGLSNFVRMFAVDSVVPLALRNMLFFVATSLILQVLLGYLMAIILTSDIAGRSFFKNVFFLPAVIPSVAIGLVWSLIYDPQMGTVTALLKLIGLGGLAHPWLLERDTALWAVTAVISWQYTGYAMIIFMAGIQNLPLGVLEAARIDGASRLQTVWRITVPLTRPIIKVEVVLIAIGSLKLFDLIYVMTGGGPVHSTEVLASYIYTQSFRQFDYGYGDAMAVVLLCLCLVVTALINALFRVEDVEY